MKEETATYALFIEGASLLAWDVSWLCHTQGLHIGSDNWESFSNMGKNLWQLLVSPPSQNHPNSIRTVSGGHDLQTKLLKIDNNKNSPKTIIQRTKSFPIFGHYSHGTSHSFLGTAEGMEFVKSWKLMTPTKLADRLKSALQGEMANAEWELLEEREWDEGLDFDPPAAAATEVPSTGADDRSESTTTTTISGNNNAETSETTKDTDSESKARTSNRPKGTSGWTKLKTR